MKAETVNPRSMRIIAAVCAVVIIAGGAAGINMLRTEASAQEAPEEKASEKNTSEKKNDDIISAGGTITSEYLSDELGMKDTSVRLTIGEVLAEAGNSVTEGTPLYQITSESLEKAEKTLRSELQTAQNALLEQNASYQIEQSKAHSLYESELLLGTTAQTDYNSGISSLYSDLQDAYDAYNEALSTINDTPSQITDKQTELEEKQKTTDSLQKKKEAAQAELDKAKEKYNSAAESYSAAASEFNSAAAAARYLGDYLGIDTADIVNADGVSGQQSKGTSSGAKQNTAKSASDGTAPTGNTPESSGKTAQDTRPSGTQQDMPERSAGNAAGTDNKFGEGFAVPSENKQMAAPDTDTNAEGSQASSDTTPAGGGHTGSMPGSDSERTQSHPENTQSVSRPSPEGMSGSSFPSSGSYPSFDLQGNEINGKEQEEEINEEEIALAAITALYEQALGEYDGMKEKLTAAKKTSDTAEKEYNELSEKLTDIESELKEAQSETSALEKEVTELENTLSKANSNVKKLEKEYTSLSTSYNADQLELKNKLDTDTASYRNAEYHYQITSATLDDELEKAQTAYDTAAENLRIFEDELADGYIRAKQDGIVYSLSFQKGRSVDLNSPFVNYVDSSRFGTTVELDQTDVTQVSIGDSVIIYSSETGVTNGRITAISAGTQKSLADVRFNVTVAADEGSSLYSGQSVNVYFNYSGMTGGFTDFSANSDREGRGSKDGGSEGFAPGGDFPGIGGGMPEGFDPSAMPDLGRRKEE